MFRFIYVFICWKMSLVTLSKKKNTLISLDLPQHVLSSSSQSKFFQEKLHGKLLYKIIIIIISFAHANVLG